MANSPTNITRDLRVPKMFRPTANPFHEITEDECHFVWLRILNWVHLMVGTQSAELRRIISSSERMFVEKEKPKQVRLRHHRNGWRRRE
jgi:hypothetical protein